ncbi:hypothetical protein HDV03_004555 [Kappamyces sp. JEL0829]|nr:hypothetical protein HDV03_004555 [Kappamyces sp. JEL0829]
MSTTELPAEKTAEPVVIVKGETIVPASEVANETVEPKEAESRPETIAEVKHESEKQLVDAKPVENSHSLSFVSLFLGAAIVALTAASLKLRVVYFNVPFSITSTTPTNSTGLGVYATTQIGYLNGDVAPGANASPSCKDNFDSTTCAEATYAALFLIISIGTSSAMVLLALASLFWKSVTGFRRINGVAIGFDVLTVLFTMVTLILTTLAGNRAQDQIVGANYRNIYEIATETAYEVGNSTLADSLAKVDALSEAYMWGVYGAGIQTGANSVPVDAALAQACPYDQEVQNVTAALKANSTLGFASLSPTDQQNLVAIGAEQLFVPCVSSAAGQLKFTIINATVHDKIYPVTYVTVVNGALNTTLPVTTSVADAKGVLTAGISSVIASKQAPILSAASSNLQATLSSTKTLEPGYYTSIFAFVLSVIALAVSVLERRKLAATNAI